MMADAQSPAFEFYAEVYSDNPPDEYWEDTPKAQEKSELALQLLQEFPLDPYAPYLLRYHLKGTSFRPATKDLVVYMDSLYTHYDSLFATKDWFFYNNMLACLITIGYVKGNMGDYEGVLSTQNKMEPYLKMAVALAKGNRERYLAALHKAFILHNNRGATLYRTTHHLDPIEKRNEVGPLIEKSFMVADSISFVLTEYSYPVLECDPTIYTNLVLLYGHYYRNDLKEQIYSRMATEMINSCKNRLAPVDMIYSEKHFNLAKVWNQFALGNYAEVINQGQVLYPEIQPLYKESSSLYGFMMQDLIFALSESFYRVNMPDSAMRYGELMIADTAYFKDYANLASVASILADLHFKRDVSKSKLYLDLSKTFLSQAQHEAVQRKIIRAGEEIALREIFERVNHMSVLVDEYDKTQKYQIMLIWGTIIIAGVLGLCFFLYKLHQSGFFLKPLSM